jgi:excisionase family DNA binding protein
MVRALSSGSGTSPTTELATLAEAAESLGVHYMTAYRYVRTGRMAAEKRGGKWWVASADLAAVLAEGTGPRRQAPDQDGAPRQLLVAPFTDRLVAGDTAGCWNIITDALSAGATPGQVHSQLLRNALVEVGEGWARGDLTIADEHRATSTTYRLLGQLGPLFRHRGRRRGTIVIGAFAGDPHGIPSAMMSDLLSDRRFSVIDLGANTPTESFVAVAQGCDDLVGIGACAVLGGILPAAVEQAKAMRAALPDAFIVVGGPALAGGAVGFDGVVDTVSSNANEACDAFDRAAHRSAQTSDGI